MGLEPMTSPSTWHLQGEEVPIELELIFFWIGNKSNINHEEKMKKENTWFLWFNRH